MINNIKSPIIDKEIEEYLAIKELEEFKKISDVIVANRLSDDIKDMTKKVYTRDLYSRD